MAPRQHASEAQTLVVTQIRSTIGTKPKHRATLRALGLKKIGGTRVVADRPEIRGMLARVSHLIEVRPSDQPVANDARVAPSNEESQ